MAWIKTISFTEADEDLRKRIRSQRESYPPEYELPIAALGEESIVTSHSLLPSALEHAFGLLAVLLSEDLPLSRKQHEMIATVVSVANRCHY